MAKPKLALVPAAQGSKFYSVLPSDGVGDFDFARASAATRINKYGLIETVASSQSRLNYALIDGVVKGCPHHILEPERRNFQTQSEYASGWISEGATLTNNEGISPSGELNASKITAIATNFVHKGYPPLVSGVISGNIYTASVFMKSSGYNFAYIRDGYSGKYVIFNLLNGTVSSEDSATGIIENYGNGWYRCSATMNTVAANFRMDTGICETSSQNPSTSWLGDGASGVLLWGAQLEAGSYPTSYIPTSGSQVTRVAETAKNAGDASTFNDSEGVLMAEVSSLVNSDTYRLISLNDNSNSNEIFLGFRFDTGKLYYNIDSAGVGQSSFISDVTALNTSCKFCVKYKQNDISFYINGFKLYSDSSANMPTGLSVLKMSRGDGTLPFYGNVKQIQYFDSALTDSELETLTSWTSFSEMAESQQYSVY
jgi:hypothetical protein